MELEGSLLSNILYRREMKKDITDACRNLKPSNHYANERAFTPMRSTIMHVNVSFAPHLRNTTDVISWTAVAPA